MKKDSIVIVRGTRGTRYVVIAEAHPHANDSNLYLTVQKQNASEAPIEVPVADCVNTSLIKEVKS